MQSNELSTVLNPDPNERFDRCDFFILMSLYDGRQSIQSLQSLLDLPRKQLVHRLARLTESKLATSLFPDIDDRLYEITPGGVMAGHKMFYYLPTYRSHFVNVCVRLGEAQAAKYHDQITPHYIQLSESEIQILDVLCDMLVQNGTIALHQFHDFYTDQHQPYTGTLQDTGRALYTLTLCDLADCLTLHPETYRVTGLGREASSVNNDKLIHGIPTEEIPHNTK